jgi:class 3 adenylate cyclase/tetratricopeptide (TPR) repeat protein
MQVCPSCGEENPDRFRLCGICGTTLAPADVAQDVRRTVSIVFSDLKGSTDLGERLDTESLREVLSEYFNEMRAVLERHGGTVEKYIGDAIMAVFGLPKLHEDDALRAVRAAFEMQRRLETLNDRLEARWGVRLENRTGVNTGEVVAGDVSSAQRLVTGDTVNTAARLEQAAPVLEILLGEATYRLVRDAVEVEPVDPLELKGKSGRVPAYLLRSVRRAEVAPRRPDAPLVGRGDELAVLTEALERATERRRAELVTVLGPAGVGKSRLLRELLVRAGSMVGSVHGRCLSYGEGITFWPLAEIVHDAARIDDDDPHDVAVSKVAALTEDDALTERLCAAIGLSDAVFPVEETFWAARRLLEGLATGRPLVVAVDDIHWAEGTLLDLIRFVAESAAAPILLVCSARGELLEEHPEWKDERDGARTLTLAPLSDEESGTVLGQLLGSTLDPGIRSRIIRAAEGNPLFVEQMLSMLIDDGVLRPGDDGEWIAASSTEEITVPPTISALLAARLDRLGATERAVIERAAVIGQVFFRGALESLATALVAPAIAAGLAGLVRKELIRPDETQHLADQEAYRFAHILIRDAAYGGLLKRRRAALHERFVDWLESVGTERVMEYEEIRGYHLEQAFLILGQLGPLDAHGRSVGERGAAYLASAGRRARSRGDMPAAAHLLRRAIRLVPHDDLRGPQLRLEAGEAFIESGDFGLADELLTESAARAAELGDHDLTATARLAWLRLRYTTEPEQAKPMVVDEVERAIPSMTERGNHPGLARAWRLLTQVGFQTSQYAAAEEATLHMMEHARLAGEADLESRFLPSLGVCALYGPTPVPEAEARCQDLLARVGGDRRATALVLSFLAHLLAMQGRFDEARGRYRTSRAILDELGLRFHAALTSIDSGAVEMLAGDPAAAEAELRTDLEVLRAMGERDYMPTTAALLAEALFRQSRFDEAEALTRECESLAAPDDVFSQYLWRCVRAKLLARRGTHEEAAILAERAVALIEESDDPDSQGNALMDLGEVYEAAGNAAPARGALERALRAFTTKGNVVSAETARARLAAIASPH